LAACKGSPISWCLLMAGAKDSKFIRLRSPRRRLFRVRSKHVGLPPGTLIHVGEKKTDKPVITVFHYTEDHFDEIKAEAIEECFSYKNKPGIAWINVDGLHDVEMIHKIGTHFNIHPLLLEDVLNTEQRPKIEELGEYLLMQMKMLHYGNEGEEIDAEQLSVFLGPRYVLSFQERPGDVFDSVRERIRTGKGRIRKSGADYLAYCLLDTVVDHYFLLLERIGEHIEALEEEVVSSPTPAVMRVIHDLKRENILMRKSIWPLREVVNQLERGASPLIEKSTLPYLRDVYEHTIQVMDTVETFRDLISGTLDIYLSSVSNRMNEIMKVLTIIGSIFFPLTLIAGIYGMNFKLIPELDWPLGYPLVLIAMLIVALVMLAYFKRKGWL